ncbi:hypothetical protein ACS0KQ_003244 [Vibrio cholerae]|nr:hypothetical protein [Vibrio cholerae]HCJ7318386.1 hypothetical protein [Vibrio cholerae]
MDKLEALSQELAAAMQQIDRSGVSDGVTHKVKPLAFEVAKNKNPYLDLLNQNYDHFICEYQKPPQAVYMPLEMLMSLIADLPLLEQQLFWVSDTKKIQGMDVKLTTDGTLRLL